MGTPIRSAPCTTCPYRQDVPAGVWSSDDYAKLRPYDQPTWAQPVRGFLCHVSSDRHCAGWAIVHSNRGHEYHLLALRLNPPDNDIPTTRLALFASGTDAADHGQSRIDDPSPEAIQAMMRLVRQNPDLDLD